MKSFISFILRQGVGIVAGLLAVHSWASSSEPPQFYPTNTESARLDPGLSGSWFDPSKDGQGFTLQVINERQLLATWFTYDADGNQAWMQGVGELKTQGIVFDVLNRYIGPEFGDDFDPKDRQTLPNGSMTLRFSSCSVGEMTYSGSDQFEGEELALERLTWLKGHECESAAPEDPNTYPPQGVLSGAWYSPATDGQGWMIEVLDEVTALVYWFTYDEEGQQRWMLGVGELKDGNLDINDLEILTGATFGRNYEASEVTRETWGNLTLHLWPCEGTVGRYIHNARSGAFSDIKPLVSINQRAPCIEVRERVYAKDIWDTENIQRWIGEDLEGKTAYCGHRSIRWNAPISNFDVNLDGVNDILLFISCYQGDDPAPSEKHNRQVKAAWHMFCSKSNGEHEDCTERLFGTPEIRATVSHDPGGGNPYTHVIEEPRDLNGDGYPEFWYALNRDDGRPGFDWDDPEDAALLEEFCGPRAPKDYEWDCTWKSIQTMLLSNADGTYEVRELPWGPRHTQAVTVLPNHLGTYDFFGLNYGEWTAARLTDQNVIIDLTEIAANEYKNVDLALLGGKPYAGVFHHEGKHYIAVSEVSQHILAKPNQDTWPEFGSADSELSGWEPGFTLWQWIPGIGFELADFHVPSEAEKFTYKASVGDDNYQTKKGAYIKNIPVYSPMWNFFSFTQLHPNEEPFLVVTQEAFTTAGQYFRAQHNPTAIYRNGWHWEEGDHQYRLMPLSVIEGFYVRNGKLVPRVQSVVDGDATWSLPGLRFVDLNGDGYMDLYGHSGGKERPVLLLNNGKGTLERLNNRSIVPDVTYVNDITGLGEYDLTFGSFTIRPLSSDGMLHFIYWGEGWSWIPDYLDPDHPYIPPEFSILKSKYAVDEIPLESLDEFNQFLESCIGKKPQCDVY